MTLSRAWVFLGGYAPTRSLTLPLPKYIVRLTADERAELDDLIRTGKRAASGLVHARLLLKAEAAAGGPGWDDGRIAAAVECGASPGYRVRQAVVEEGLAAARFRKKPTGRQYRKLDGAQEAQLIALACGTPPEGRRGWTLRLLADRLVELAVGESISPECVRMTLQKRTQAHLAEAVGDPAAGQCRLRLCHGGRACRIHPAVRPGLSGGVGGRDPQATGGRNPPGRAG